MSTFVIACWAITAIFNLLTLYFVWHNLKVLKELERLRKDVAGHTTTGMYHIGDLAPGESKEFEIRFGVDENPELVERK